MTLIHVVGVGLDGAQGINANSQQLIAAATLLVGSERHLSYFPDAPADRFRLGDLSSAIAHLQAHLRTRPTPSVVVLTSGDPLFFGLGRLLLQEFAADDLTFHPHLSSIQLAFNRVKLPWQDAKIISAHGRSLDELIQALQQGTPTLAVLTDPTNTPAAIAQLLAALDLPTLYQIWVCENLGGATERILTTTSDATQLAQLAQQTFDPLNVVVLQRTDTTPDLDPANLPHLGIPDSAFCSFPDRPGLMTKREVRVLALAELALQPGQMIWDIGAGTGSVAIEMARLCPTATIYAIEKTAVGISLIQQNLHRFQVNTIQPIQGSAPHALSTLPHPDRIFIGGSGGYLTAILDVCSDRLKPSGRIVLALATLDHLTTTLSWLHLPAQQHQWQYHLLQVQVCRSIPISALTRWAPLNPVTLVILKKK
jgi:precorrin-6Y C5,15-methyltransferase (decarboxylating)